MLLGKDCLHTFSSQQQQRLIILVLIKFKIFLAQFEHEDEEVKSFYSKFRLNQKGGMDREENEKSFIKILMHLSPKGSEF